MVYSWMATQMGPSMHVCSWLRVPADCLDGADLVSDLHRRLCGVSRVESLVVGETIQVLIVLVIHFEVVFTIRISLEVVEKAEQNLKSHQTVRACLMLGSHAHNGELFCDLIQTTVQVETVHE